MRDEERVLLYHPRSSSFPQIRDRKQAATGNRFVQESSKGLMAKNQHKKIIKKSLWMAEAHSLFICVIARVRKQQRPGERENSNHAQGRTYGGRVTHSPGSWMTGLSKRSWRRAERSDMLTDWYGYLCWFASVLIENGLPKETTASVLSMRAAKHLLSDAVMEQQSWRQWVVRRVNKTHTSTWETAMSSWE